MNRGGRAQHRGLASYPSPTNPDRLLIGLRNSRILFDSGGLLIGGTECKKLSASSQSFTDMIVHVE